MCGLTGFWHPEGGDRERLCEIVGRMADTMEHRGPDDRGVWVDPAAGLALGFRRLSIIDLSPAGHQPMTSADGRFVIVFNGEIYNFLELRAELENRGHRFRGRSDTEVILEASCEWGPEAAIRRLWGMFAIAVWDRRERALLLARDRLGKKPLYYGRLRGVFMFGSELKSLRAHPAFVPEINRDALGLYLRHGNVPTPHSIFLHVHKLRQGHVLTVHEDGRAVMRPYWDAREVIEGALAHPLQLSDNEATETLDVLLRDAVARRMIADVPLGALLSGGVDSSLVASLMQAQSSRPVKTFTIGFHEAHYNEARAAKAVASHLRTEHTELYVTPEQAVAVIPRLPYLYDEPFADSSQIPTFLVCEMARQHVTVSLSGDGGDELFGGYNRYLWAEALWRRLRYLPFWARRGVARAVRSVSPRRWDGVYARVEPWLPQRRRQRLAGNRMHKAASWLAVRNEDELYRGIVSQWSSPDLVVIDGAEPPTPLLDPTLRESFPNFTERMMYLDLVTYLPDDILVKVDRASMGVSLETRSPLLDHRLVEWIWRLPLSLKNRDGQSKWLLRQLLYKYVPRDLIDRPKMGFGVPIEEWLRGPLREWAECLLDESRIRHEGFFRFEPIRRAWAAHLSGRANEHYRLWSILMFQAWRDAWHTI